MKRVICLLLACVMIMCLFVACGDEDGQTQQNGTKQTEAKRTPEKASEVTEETKKDGTDTKSQSEKTPEKTNEATLSPETEKKTEQTTKKETPYQTSSPETNTPSTQPPVVTQAPATNPPATQPPSVDPKPCDHSETQMWNVITPQKDPNNFMGYTGDKYCKKCNALLESGKFQLCHIETGAIITLENANDDPLLKTLKSKGRPSSHDSDAVKALEIQMNNAVNAERAKYGLAPLTLVDEASWYSYQRALECVEFAHRNDNYYLLNQGAGDILSHTRPNGKYYSSLFDEDNIFYYKVYDSGDGFPGAAYAVGENLVMSIGSGITMDTLVAYDVDQWMNSTAHRENILNGAFTRTTISIHCFETENGLEQYAVQHFFA